MNVYYVHEPPELRRFPPRFSLDSSEQRFRLFHSAAAVKRSRIALALAIGLYLGFGVLDRFLGEPAVNTFLAIRIAFSALLALSLALTWHPVWRWAGQYLIALCGVAGSSGIAAMIVLATHEVTKTTFFVGIILIAMFISGFGLVRTLFALTASTLSGVVAIVAMSAAHTNPGVFFSDTFFLCSAVLIATVSSYLIDLSEREAWQRQQTITAQIEIIGTERERADNLLVNVLPATIADRLKSGESPIADSFDDVSVLFADVENFTPLAERIGPSSLVNLLDEIFTSFDLLAAKFGVEKVKTIGDAYMAVCGAPVRAVDHAERIVKFAFAIIDAAHEVGRRHGENIRVRVGINSGPAIGGVIGKNRIVYDLWGDTVNVASRLEDIAAAGGIMVGGRTYDLVQYMAPAVCRMVALKGKGEVPVYELLANPDRMEERRDLRPHQADDRRQFPS